MLVMLEQFQATAAWFEAEARDVELAYMCAPVGIDGVATAETPDRRDLLEVDLSFGAFVDDLLERIERGRLAREVLDAVLLFGGGGWRYVSLEELAEADAVTLIRAFA